MGGQGAVDGQGGPQGRHCGHKALGGEKCNSCSRNRRFARKYCSNNTAEHRGPTQHLSWRKLGPQRCYLQFQQYLPSGEWNGNSSSSSHDSADWFACLHFVTMNIYKVSNVKVKVQWDRINYVLSLPLPIIIQSWCATAAPVVSKTFPLVWKLWPKSIKYFTVPQWSSSRENVCESPGNYGASDFLQKPFNCLDSGQLAAPNINRFICLIFCTRTVSVQ